MNLTQFFKQWKKGLKNLTIAQQISGKIAGCYGNIIGMFTGAFTMSIIVFFSYDYKWWWSILVLLIAGYMNILELIGLKQQLKQVKDTEKLLLGGNNEPKKHIQTKANNRTH